MSEVMAWLLFKMCCTRGRNDLPGRTIAARLQHAWTIIQGYYSPHAAPIKDLEVSRFRPSTSDGLRGISFKAKAKETWDIWPGVLCLVRSHCKNSNEKQMAEELDVLVRSVKLHYIGHGDKTRWLAAEIKFLCLCHACGFPMTPKFHLLQHVFLQLQDDCAPRYAYCFAEETKNAHLAELAKRALNWLNLPETVVWMHEMWASAGCPTMVKHKRQRQQSMEEQTDAKRRRVIEPEVTIQSDSDAADLEVQSESEATDLEIG